MASKRIFYGWWVLAGATLIYSVSSGLMINTLPLLYPNLMDEFGWDPEQVTRPATIFFILGAVVTPFISALLDKFSVKKIMIFSIIGFLCTFSSFYLIRSLAHITIVYAIIAVMMVGCALVPNMLLITRWFRRYRGIATGILLTGTSFSGAIFPLIVKKVLDNGGDWRQAILTLATIAGFLMIGAVIFLIRNTPDEMGLSPDGNDSTEHIDELTKIIGFKLSEVIRTPVFYLLAFINCSLWFCIMSMLQHQSIYFSSELGISRNQLPIFFSIFFWCAVVGKLIFGWLSDHYNKIIIMLIAVINLTLGLLAIRFSTPETIYLLYLYTVIYGIGFSGAFTMIQLLIAHFFSGNSFGRILGLYMMIEIIAGGIGVGIVGRIQTANGSYAPAFDTLIGLNIIVALTIIVLYKYHHILKTRPISQH